MAKKFADDRAAVDWLAAIADPNRLSVVRILAGGSKNVTEMAKTLGIEIVNLSHHLNVMRQAGVVANERKGRFIIYSLVGARSGKDKEVVMTHDESGLIVNIPL